MEFGFENLTAWQKSRILVKEVYELIKIFPQYENLGLSSQLRRSVISVASNLAEGKGRFSMNDQIHFCHMAYGSLMEVTNQIILAQDLGYITHEQYKNLRPLIEEVAKLINGYRNYLRTKY